MDTQDTVTPTVLTDDVQTETTDSADTQAPEIIIDESGASVIQNLETLIKSHITGIDARKNELGKLREMLSDVLVNDEVYRKMDEEAKAAAKKRGQTKSELMKAPQNQDLLKKVQLMSTEIKEMDEALSDYLREFQRLTGSNEIEADDGTIREIVYTAKLIKKASRGK